MPSEAHGPAVNQLVRLRPSIAGDTRIRREVDHGALLDRRDPEVEGGIHLEAGGLGGGA